MDGGDDGRGCASTKLQVSIGVSGTAEPETREYDISFLIGKDELRSRFCSVLEMFAQFHREEEEEASRCVCGPLWGFLNPRQGLTRILSSPPRPRYPTPRRPLLPSPPSSSPTSSPTSPPPSSPPPHTHT
jgi:hypothetical protein